MSHRPESWAEPGADILSTPTTGVSKCGSEGRIREGFPAPWSPTLQPGQLHLQGVPSPPASVPTKASPEDDLTLLDNKRPEHHPFFISQLQKCSFSALQFCWLSLPLN